MQEDTKRRRGRRKKKSKVGYYLYAIVVLVLTIANITLAVALLTHVQNITVTGNNNSSSAEIIAWIKEDSMTNNSIYTWWKYNFGSYKKPVYLEKVDVSLSAPWKVQVNVKEKQSVACVAIEGNYLYFDKNGLVLKKESEYTDKLPLIEGMDLKDTAKYRTLLVEDEKVLSHATDIAMEIQKNDLQPDRVKWEEESMNLYFGEVCVKMGKMNYQEKVIQLPPILEELEGKSGVLNLEHYTSDSKMISFEKNEKKNTEEP